MREYVVRSKMLTLNCLSVLHKLHCVFYYWKEMWILVFELSDPEIYHKSRQLIDEYNWTVSKIVLKVFALLLIDLSILNYLMLILTTKKAFWMKDLEI